MMMWERPNREPVGNRSGSTMVQQNCCIVFQAMIYKRQMDRHPRRQTDRQMDKVLNISLVLPRGQGSAAKTCFKALVCLSKSFSVLEERVIFVRNKTSNHRTSGPHEQRNRKKFIGIREIESQTRHRSQLGRVRNRAQDGLRRVLGDNVGLSGVGGHA